MTRSLSIHPFVTLSLAPFNFRHCHPIENRTLKGLLLNAHDNSLKVFFFWSIISQVQEDSVTKTKNCEEILKNGRRHLRTVFTYPVEFKVLSQKAESMSFVGYLKDISLDGAGLEIEDQYGRFNTSEAENG
jgi:hypothetical protein